MRQVAGTLRLDLAQYRELAAFAQFGSELDKATQAQLARGQRLTLVLKQDQFAPLTVEKQVLVIFAGTNGYFDDVDVLDIERFQRDLLAFADAHCGSLLQPDRHQEGARRRDPRRAEEGAERIQGAIPGGEAPRPSSRAVFARLFSCPPSSISNGASAR